MDLQVLRRYEAIVQQVDCVGCRPLGLAAAISFMLPYGCPYKAKRQGEKASSYAVPEDWSVPGSIIVRQPPENTNRKWGRLPYNNHPAVISIYGQWGWGPNADKHTRAPCPQEYGQDTPEDRERWFQDGLDKISDLADTWLNIRPRSLAFPWKMSERFVREQLGTL